MPANQIPERLINFTAYKDGSAIIGVTDIKLPSIEFLTDTVSGAGISGELETPILGHVKSMSTSFKSRTVTNDIIKLAAQSAHQIDFRGSQQVYDSATGTYSTVPIRVTMKLMPKKVDLGNFQVAKPTDSDSEFEVLYIKIFLDGKEVLEIDKLNFICSIDGNDILASVRSDIGL